ncbi:MAG: selenide, water dikinase SelD [Candidatus Acidiferrales bacterium]
MPQAVKLTAMAKTAGCAAKLAPGTLDAVLRRLPPQTDPQVLVGFDTNDDAGVYRLSDDLALVQTVDFFTPIVDSPYDFGQVAAVNALSDVYAMGGRPISALSIVAFPEKGDPALLEEIMRGGLHKMNEAGCSILGGHSIRDDDLKFGYAVSGLIHPGRIWRNVGSQPGDVLILTKPLGTGVLSTALKKEGLAPDVLAALVASMTRLNRAAAEPLLELDRIAVHAVTDVTGFSLLGHAREMALGDPASGAVPVSMEFDHTRFAWLPGAMEAARQGHLSGGLRNNREFIGDCVAFSPEVPQEVRELCFDPQTSGGLLAAIATGAAGAALAALGARGVSAQAIGRVVPRRSPLLSVG